MKKKKCISKIVIGVTAIAICCSMFTAASNYKDTDFDFYFQLGTVGYSNTEMREKQDDTSAYMKCNSTTYSYTACVIGSYSLTGVKYDLSGGHSYTFNSGTVHKMINYVFENKVPYAGIHAEKNYSYSCHATGVWSPDSI